MFIQEQRFSIRDIMDATIIPLSDDCKNGGKCGGRKKRKVIIPRPAQQNNNDKRSRHYFSLLARGNFGKNDYYGTFTFSNETLPKNPDDAKKIFKDKFIRKARDLYKKNNTELKYLFVMEYQEEENSEALERIHFHFLMSGGVNRDLVEGCWSVGRGKKKISLGRTNLRIIQPDSDGIKALVNYLNKGPRWKKGVKLWSGSRNLERPVKQVNNSKFSLRKVEKMAMSNDQGMDELSKIYPNYWITNIETKYNELKGWHIYLEMVRKREDRKT